MRLIPLSCQEPTDAVVAPSRRARDLRADLFALNQEFVPVLIRRNLCPRDRPSRGRRRNGSTFHAWVEL